MEGLTAVASAESRKSTFQVGEDGNGLVLGQPAVE
jgi:hypothetical protein